MKIECPYCDAPQALADIELEAGPLYDHRCDDCDQAFSFATQLEAFIPFIEPIPSSQIENDEIEEMARTLFQPGPSPDELFGVGIRAAKQRIIRYSVRKGNRLAWYDHAETKQIIAEAVDYLASLCNVTFVKVSDERQAHVRFSTWNNEEMWRLGGSKQPKRYPGGLAGRDWVAINRERPMSWQSIVYIAMHEIGHWFGMGHTAMSDRGAMMHPYAEGPPLPKEVVWIQRRFRAPPKLFFPYLRGQYGDRIREHSPVFAAARANRVSLLATRDEIFFGPDKEDYSFADRQSAQQAVLNQLHRQWKPAAAKAKSLSDLWTEQNNKWKNTDADVKQVHIV